MKKVIFEGAGVAIVTPFNRDRSINYEQLERLIEFQISGGIDAIISCGTTGEAATLTEEEHLEIVRFTAEKIDGRVPLIASAGSNDTMFSIELATEIEKIGVDGLLLVTPYYNKTSQKGLVESFSLVADSTALPVIVYNVPSRTTVNILPDTYLALSKHPKIVGVKEANHDVSSVAKTISLCGDALTIYSGEDDQTLPIMALGGKGVISVIGNVMPREIHELCAAMLREEYAVARAMTSKYIKLMNSLFMDVNPIPVKEALSLMGYCSNTCRLPLTDMSDEGKSRLSAIMKEYQLI